MPRLIAVLIRHGDYHQLPDTPSAHQPFPLNNKGREQAAQAVQILREVMVGRGWRLLPVIDCSRMLRAWETARIFADGLADLSSLAPTLEEFDELAERGLGCAANLTVAQIDGILAQDPRHVAPPPNWKADSRYRLPLQGAESLLDAGARVAAHLSTRMAAASGEGVKLFVGHGAAFRHAAYHLGVLEYEQIARLSMYHARPVFLQYLQPGEWRHIAGDWKVRDKDSRYMD